jgi:hypothetical protein
MSDISKEDIDILIQSMRDTPVAQKYTKRKDEILASLDDISEHWSRYTETQRDVIYASANLLLSVM